MVAAQRLALAASVLALVSLSAQAFQVHHRVLVLSKPGYVIDSTTIILEAYNVPYDLLLLDTTTVNQLTDNSTWLNPDGSAAYSAIIMQPDVEGDGTLNQAQVTAMWSYTATYKIRTVKINAWPTNHGMNIGTTNGALDCTSGAQNATFLPAATSTSAFTMAGLNPAVAMSLSGIYRCPAVSASNWCGIWASDFATTGLGGPCTVTPLVQTPAIAGTTNTAPVTTVWTVTMAADGREVMVFGHDCEAWAPACLVLAHYQLSWVLKSLVPGYRRAMLNTMVDDMFLETEYGVVETPNSPQFRCTVNDLTSHVVWFNNITTKVLPAGSDYRGETCFNGDGILDSLNSNAYIDIFDDDCSGNPLYNTSGCNCFLMDITGNTCTSPVEFCQQCQKNWPKPPGYGTDELTLTYDQYVNGDAKLGNTAWSLTEMMKSPLFAAVRNNQGNIAEGWFWIHHTFTHQDMDNITYNDAVLQLKLNQLMANKDWLGLDTRDTWSNYTLVTPGISGLCNSDNLNALKSVGINVVIGDNTWKYLTPNKTHSLFYTTMAGSNYLNYPVIPRFATEVYFNCTTPQLNLALYNKVYASQIGNTSSWDTVLDREASRVLQAALLQVRHDPHMFHQANLNTVGTTMTGMFGQPASMLMAWVERIVQEYVKYAKWPIISVKADDVYKYYKAREARDACNFDYVLNVNGTTGNVDDVIINALSACAVPAPLMAPSNATLAFAAGTSTVEKLGNEEPTYWGNPGSKAAVTGLAWAAAA